MYRSLVSALALSAGVLAAACMDNTATDKTTVTNPDGTKTTVVENRDGTTTTKTTRDGATPVQANGTAYDASTANGVAAANGVPTQVDGNASAMAMLTALNQGEVDQANAAIPKLAHKEAKYFATMMQRHHSEGLTKLSGIAAAQNMTMTDVSASRAMKAESADLVGKMSTMTAGPAFDRIYMQAQIDGHIKALKMIDSEILPKVENADLKTLVTDMRKQVADHLAKAQEILPSMPAT